MEFGSRSAWDTVMMTPMSSSSSNGTPSPAILEPQMSAANPLAPRKRGRPPNAVRAADLQEQYERRRLSNRMAAQRCRTRRTEEKRILEEKVAQLEKIIKDRESTIDELKDQLSRANGQPVMPKRPLPIRGRPKPIKALGAPCDLALIKSNVSLLPSPKAVRFSPRLASKAMALNTPSAMYSLSEWASFKPVDGPIDGLLATPSLLTPTTNSTVVVTSPTTSRNYALL